MKKDATSLSYKSILKVAILLILVIIGLVSVSTYSPLIETASISEDRDMRQKFWQYQCFDTMKTSRDKARAWSDDPKLEQYIEREMKAIVDLGGNCVAIATPYDEEFLPVLEKWVAAARRHNLHIWFRGNFSAWEGWFEYPKGMTANEHHQKTVAFIEQNAELFADGDIFTPSPEAENGGPSNQVEKDEHQVFRKYLIEEYTIAKNAFEKINKEVEVNWLSMNGGLAMRMLDQNTVDTIGGVVTIDHYIKTAPEMGQFIEYFKNNFNAKVVIGEFGAPIPEINGPMSETAQAEFVDLLFEQLVKHKDDVYGINYWTLWDGSAALYNPDWSEREVVNVVKKYMKPGIIIGTITSTIDEPIADATITIVDHSIQTQTDSNGNYTLLLPAGQYKIEVTHQDYTSQTENTTVDFNSQQAIMFSLIPKDQSLWYRIKLRIFGLKDSFS